MADPLEFPVLPEADRLSIQNFVQGKKKSVPGARLTLEYADNAIKLIDPQKTIVAVSKQLNEWQQKVLLYRHADRYFPELVKHLGAQAFLATKRSRHPDYAEYSKYQTPSGYQLQYRPARILGQVWLEAQSRSGGSQTQGPLVFQGNNWYPIQELKIDRSVIQLRTLVGELSIEAEDPVVWIEPVVTPPVVTPPTQPPTAPNRSATTSSVATNPTPATKPTVSMEPIPESLPPTTPKTIPSAQPKNEIEPSPPATLGQLKQAAKAKALGRIIDYLNEGDIVTSTEVLKNGQGQVISTKTTQVKRACPRWVVEQVKQF
jgi:hypothetical protein